ncbi:hypothetical protein PULV_b0774 [Pseudoalteromonas ulvae UL12]|nr:hypothetical protein [Pseudoalteromonas ulvae UL12]
MVYFYSFELFIAVKIHEKDCFDKKHHFFKKNLVSSIEFNSSHPY